MIVWVPYSEAHGSEWEDSRDLQRWASGWAAALLTDYIWSYMKIEFFSWPLLEGLETI